MGRVVTLGELKGTAAGEGVSAAPITAGETPEMAAEYIRIEPGKRWSEKAPRGADCYLFALNGEAKIRVGDTQQAFAAETFATVQEGSGFTVHNEGAATLDVVKVIAPPRPNGKLSGFAGKLDVAARATTPVVPVPTERKQRIYFAGGKDGHGAPTERGHAMIVVYDGQTRTPLHYHPNADSLFVLLDGAVEFTVNGEQVVVKPGQAAYFPTNDKHGLHTAPGHSGASFLEFHIPAAFTTVKE